MFGVQPYITFQGNCEEAINFYKDCMNGEVLFIQRYEGSPMAQQGIGNKIMHITLKIGDSHIMACDNMLGQPVASGSSISLTVGSDDVAHAEKMFKKMAEGGKITMPLQKTFWAESFGTLTDKFAINWIFNCDRPHEEGKTPTT